MKKHLDNIGFEKGTTIIDTNWFIGDDSKS